jgi:hypothetical protein
MIKQYYGFLLSGLFIFCTEIKSMDFFSTLDFDFTRIVLRVFDVFSMDDSEGQVLAVEPKKSLSAIEQKKPSRCRSIIDNSDGTSTLRFVFDENKHKNIGVGGCGQLFLNQVGDRSQGLIEITTDTHEIERFAISYFPGEETIFVGPLCSKDKAKYSCSIYAKCTPNVSLQDKVSAVLATNITSESLVFKLQNEACVLQSNKRIKVQFLRIHAFDKAKIMGLQGIATRQDLCLSDQAQYTSQLNSNWVNIHATQRSKIDIYFGNELRRPGSINGRLGGLSELRYSGNPVVSDLWNSDTSLLERIEK